MHGLGLLAEPAQHMDWARATGASGDDTSQETQGMLGVGCLQGEAAADLLLGQCPAKKRLQQDHHLLAALLDASDPCKYREPLMLAAAPLLGVCLFSSWCNRDLMGNQGPTV